MANLSIPVDAFFSKLLAVVDDAGLDPVELASPGNEDDPAMRGSEALGAVGVAPLHATVNAHKPITRCRM